MKVTIFHSISLDSHPSTALNIARPMLATIILAALTGCGGGGGGSTTTPTIPSSNIPPTQITVNSGELSGTFVQQIMTNTVDVWELQNSAGEYIKGQGITIATVDTGANLFHEDFRDDEGYLRVNLDDAISITYSDNLNILDYNQSFIDIDTDDYHGTHVSSIALGREYGIAPEATLLPVNTYYYWNGDINNDPGYYTDNFLRFKGFEYSASKASIVNISSSDMVNLSNLDGSSSELNSYLTTLQNNDVALVVAAGNEGIAIGAEHFNDSEVTNIAIQPGIENQVLSVIALNGTDPYLPSNTYEKTYYTNYPGSCEDGDVDGGCSESDKLIMEQIQSTFISAPGGTSPSEGISAADGATVDQSKQISGTSMAAPVVSGGLALLMSAWDQLTPQQAVKLLKESADKSFTGYTPAKYGVGILDIEAAFEPSGDLKSTASMSSSAAYSLTESSASIPAGLSGLAELSALESVAYFDDYNRDYAVDITPAIQIEKIALDWNQFWINSHAHLATNIRLDDYALSVSFDSIQPDSVKSLALRNQYSAFQYFKNSSNSVIETSSNPLASHFYSNNQPDFGATLAMQQAITPKLAFFTAVQEQDNRFSRVQNTQNKTLAQVQTMGLSYQLTNNLSLGLSSQLRQEQDSFMGLQGNGTFSFGENNQSQLNTLSLQYALNDIRLFSQLQQGQLLNSNQAAGSYINLEKAEMGQFKLGVMQALSPQTSWGLQAYNYNSLLHSDISLTLPVGMSSTGEVESQTIRYTQKNSLQPDTVELFYKTGSEKSLQYQINAIHSPDDSGFGLKLYQKF